ncbi:hypothetical protein [Streptomyces sp. WELS2]|uniref:hypothetical protein n=1 Tax=Streptomyces sp. WELS2 TaxID=2749435 RepID=UPI0015F0DFB9|nr:hypothetical protein [Streptomyces sp. WELS2]
MTVIKKTATAACTVALTLAGVLFVAPAAHADADGCTGVLTRNGYTNPDLADICRATADDSLDTDECVQELLDQQVDAPVALEACLTAQN